MINQEGKKRNHMNREKLEHENILSANNK